MASIIMVKPVKPMEDEARWKCEVCGKELAYSQPASFEMVLELVKVFGDYHNANCKGFAAREGGGNG